MATRPQRLSGVILASAAVSSRCVSSMAQAAFWVKDSGSLKVTGSVILLKSFPMLLLMIYQRPPFVAGSFSQGNCSLVAGSSAVSSSL